MSYLFHDFETASEIDLAVRGLDNYVKHPSTRVLMLAYAFDDEPVKLWCPVDPHSGGIVPMSDRLRAGLEDPAIVKVAWNAPFERNVWRYVLGIWIPYEQWLDPSVLARHLSMPQGLEEVGEIVGLRQDQAKIERGKALVKLFCEPAQDGGETALFGTTEAVFRNARTNPKEWEEFEEYCKRDVTAERAILKKLAKFPLPEIEQRGWILDQIINDRGIPVDMPLVNGAVKIAEETRAELFEQMRELTGLANPNSNDQMLEWLQKQGYPFSSLNKAFAARAMRDEAPELTDLGRQVLEIRKVASKTSWTKLLAIRDNVSADGRLRHQFNFLGAARAGRWTGRDVQLQNLARPVKEVEKNMDSAIEMLTAGDLMTLNLAFSSALDTVTSCLRCCFRAPDGSRLDVCDLGAIENRVLGWVAGCDSILKVFRDGLDPYVSFAVFMYGEPYEVLIKDKDKRQQAKPAVLGAGYRLGGGDEVQNEDGDWIRTGLWGYAQAMGVEMTREAAHESVRIFRETYPEVVQLWYDLENAAFAAMEGKGPQTVGPITFEVLGKTKKLLRIMLPSGRGLHYIQPKLEWITTPWDPNKKKLTLTYMGVDQQTKQWTRTTTHGGKLTENIVQAIARDLLLHSMLLAEEKELTTVGHVHDEIITLQENVSPLGLDDLRTCMITQPAWAQDLPLDAAGFSGIYYKKG